MVQQSGHLIEHDWHPYHKRRHKQTCKEESPWGDIGAQKEDGRVTTEVEMRGMPLPAKECWGLLTTPDAKRKGWDRVSPQAFRKSILLDLIP